MKSNISQARINQEIRNMIKQPLSYLRAAPLQNDLYTWHFTIQGPENSDFHQGLYHGQILLPFEYPFKPPDIVFMNKNARFQTNTKICLTITQYHPEEWNSAWTIRTMLEAVISLLNENIQGIGYEEGSSQQRKHLAKKSHDFKCDKCGVLKEILQPRQPQKQQQKKQEQKNDQNSDIPQGQKLEYASDLSFRKVKTEDNRTNFSNQTTKLLQEKKQNRNQSSNQQKQNQKQRPNKQNIKANEQKNEASKKTENTLPTFKYYCPQNNSIGLDKKSNCLSQILVNKNFLSWAKVLKSQKWSVIQ